MSIRYRPMRPKDVRECVAIVAAHPILGQRYGRTVDQLGPAWLRVLGTPAFHACVFEEVDGTKIRLLGCATNTFVSDEFMLIAKIPPFFWIGPELTKQVMSGKSPLLSDTQVQEANSVSGLNIVVWPSCLLPDEQKRTDVNQAVMTSFMEHHQGYLLKELMVQATNAEEVQIMMNMGGLFLGGGDGSYVGSVGRPPHEVLAEPHYFGVTRDLALQRMGTWVSAVFAYQRPQFGLRPSEQKLLLAALRDGTDEELSDELAVSLSAVKKAWHSVYERAAECLPHSILNNEGREENSNGERGKQKKQRLLAYLRDHPEELRPYSRKTQRQARNSSS